jgi:hypothetical protein
VLPRSTRSTDSFANELFSTCVCVCVCACACACARACVRARNHFGSRYRHRYFYESTSDFLLVPGSVVFMLTFTAVSLFPLVYLLH